MRLIEITAVIAPNGLGHLRRTCGVLDALARRVPACRVTVVCEPWQIEALTTTGSARRVLGAAAIVSGVTEPGVRWTTYAGAYDDGRLLDWELRLGASGVLDDADLVVSDNLVGVLDARPDTVLFGSFLWSDIFAGSDSTPAAVGRFVAHERGLLNRHRPPMVCVGDVAMPGVVDRTEAVPVSWMCDEEFIGAGEHSDVIAVLGGRSGALDDPLAAAAAQLLANGYRVAASAPVLAALPHGLRWSATLFEHSAEDYRCGVVVCRPGTGAITDCVAAGVPMALFHDGSNGEMSHNARRATELGIGIEVTTVPDLLYAAEVLLGPGGDAARSRIVELPKNGLEEAAAWLEGWLHERRLLPSGPAEAAFA